MKMRMGRVDPYHAGCINTRTNQAGLSRFRSTNAPTRVPANSNVVHHIHSCSILGARDAALSAYVRTDGRESENLLTVLNT